MAIIPKAGINKIPPLEVSESTYKVIKSNWYKSLPYGFRHNNEVFFLPISPQNLTITTNFATNLITTLYGVVEEHSENRYFDIVIEGTTGMTPKFINPVMVSGDGITEDNIKAGKNGSGRSSFSVDIGGTFSRRNMSNIGAFQRALGVVENMMNAYKKAKSAIFGDDAPSSGVKEDSTGYLAFHNLYRWLLEYKKQAANPKSAQEQRPLVFFNLKDNNMYDVTVQRFILRRSADNPMVYQYMIQLRGYNLRDAQGSSYTDDINERVKELGLDGVSSSSIFSKMKRLNSAAKTVVKILTGGVFK